MFISFFVFFKIYESWLILKLSPVNIWYGIKEFGFLIMIGFKMQELSKVNIILDDYSTDMFIVSVQKLTIADFFFIIMWVNMRRKTFVYDNILMSQWSFNLETIDLFNEICTHKDINCVIKNGILLSSNFFLEMIFAPSYLCNFIENISDIIMINRRECKN